MKEIWEKVKFNISWFVDEFLYYITLSPLEEKHSIIHMVLLNLVIPIIVASVTSFFTTKWIMTLLL